MFTSSAAMNFDPKSNNLETSKIILRKGHEISFQR